MQPMDNKASSVPPSTVKQVIVIPSRYASTRLPGKPLVDILGKTMIQRVYEQALKANKDETIVATDDERIEKSLVKLGYQVCMTRADHQSGTDRLAEVVKLLKLRDEDIIINVQGDEPLIPIAVINQVASLLIDNPQASMATLSTPISDVASLHNPNVVKVVANRLGQAMYFSRAPIAWHRDSNNHQNTEALADFDYQRHIGLYAYRAGFLKEFSQWPTCDLEKTESLEQLRALWQGHTIQIAPAIETVPEGIDTSEDLERVKSLLS